MSKYRIIKIARTTFILVMMMGLGACANNNLRKNEFEPPVYDVSPPPAPTNGSIFSSQYKITLFKDKKANQVGDLLTVVLVEQTTASKSADIVTDKETTINIANPTVLGRAVTFGSRSLATNIATENEFEGSGSANQSNRLDGSVSVVVEQVLPNGNLRVRGQKLITINQGDEFVRVTGLVRPEDIRGDNTVLSTQIADAHFSYGGRGVIADSNSMGWLARFFNSPYWPL
ncbi:MAG: flagellar basal body L-ring protein FlgH [Gammaproteobacteria bacterium]|nr:flagellar basal body L-ring protein FlgH [Gammaproteobacteria bacterium]